MDDHDHFHVADDSASVDQTHAEAINTLRKAEAFVLLAMTRTATRRCSAGHSAARPSLAVLLRASLDAIYENAILVAAQIEETHVRENALRDLATWEPAR